MSFPSFGNRKRCDLGDGLRTAADSQSNPIRQRHPRFNRVAQPAHVGDKSLNEPHMLLPRRRSTPLATSTPFGRAARNGGGDVVGGKATGEQDRDLFNTSSASY